MARAEDTRARIVHAAEEVVLRDGVARLTIEAAAAESAMSKGGILYHFPTRDSLVSAMVDRLASSFDSDLARFLAEEASAECGPVKERQAASGSSTQSDAPSPAEASPRPGAFTRAYLRATFAPGGDERDARLGAAVIAGVAADPALLSVLRERFETWQRRIEKDGIPPATATLARLAADGLWLVELLRLAPPDAELRAMVGEELLGTTRIAAEADETEEADR